MFCIPFLFFCVFGALLLLFNDFGVILYVLYIRFAVVSRVVLVFSVWFCVMYYDCVCDV